MSKLYELSTEMSLVNDELIANEGELTPEIEARLDSLNLALEVKATGIRKIFAMAEADAEAVNTEIKRLQRIKKINENMQARLKEYVLKNMQAADLKTIKTTIGTFTVAKSPDSLDIVVPELIPAEFYDTIPERKVLNEKRIREALSEGYEVDGAKLNSDRVHLRIK